MDYLTRPKWHYRPEKGWMSDPNGLVWFDGWYHVFYQHAPDHELPWKQPMHWGHARTKNFIDWEELSVALTPGDPYDGGGCWSGTAIVRDGKLYLFYAAITAVSTIAVAVSEDGVHFQKYAGNPVIDTYPPDGGPDFRDPAVCRIGDSYFCVVASGNPERKTGVLLLYRSSDLLHWTYEGVLCEAENCKYAECPSFMQAEDGLCLLTTSFCPLDGMGKPYFQVLYGEFRNGKFDVKHAGRPDRGPDQYAGQVFRDPFGRNLLITWIPGWEYQGYAEKDIGCMSVPREMKLTGGKITAYPVEEVRHLLKSEDPALRRTETGFTVERRNRPPLVYEGGIRDLRILRDGYLMEIFVNGGEETFSVLL